MKLFYILFNSRMGKNGWFMEQHESKESARKSFTDTYGFEPVAILEKEAE